MAITKNKLLHVILLIILAAFLKFIGDQYLEPVYSNTIRLIVSLLILIIGAVFIIRKCASIIEETTEVLSYRTKLAGGFLQSLGTAFPDMVLGVVAALVSLRMRETDYSTAVNYAVIAASTTFGSNIYNVGHAAWCIYRQNLANKLSKKIRMFPHMSFGSFVTPMSEHQLKPSINEIEVSIEVSTLLTVLTALVAATMVLFGRISQPPMHFVGDLYQLIRPAGLLIFLATTLILFVYRKSERETHLIDADSFYASKSTFYILFNLLLTGAAILFSAEAMVKAIEVFCAVTGTPLVIAGVASGLIGCLGEILVVHNYTINPAGRIGDAITGVAMDNIVTIMGASIVSLIGGIFLGGSSLILIFVLVFVLNTVLIWQLSKLKDALYI